jgi:PAS domain S-box-containing protein
MQPASTNVLIVSDDASYVAGLEEVLSASVIMPFVTTKVTTVEAALRDLVSRPANVVLLDLALPDALEPVGLELLRSQHGAAVVLLADPATEPTAREALKVGLHFLRKFGADEHETRRAIRDAAAQARSQWQLEQTRDLLESIIEASPLAIVGLNREGCVILWNSAAEQLFGWEQKEVTGKPSPLIPAERKGEHTDLIARALEGEVTADYETWRQRRDGSLIQVALSYAPIHDSTGVVQGVMGIFRDVTESKRLEDQLHTRVRQQEAVAQFGQRALTQLELNPLFDEAVDIVSGTLGLDRVGVVEFDWNEPCVVVHASRGLAPAGHRIPYPSGPTIAARAARLQHPVIVEDIATDNQFDWSNAGTLGTLGVVSLLSVPIHGVDRSFGNFVAASSTRRTFSTDEVTFVQSIANTLAMAIERERTEDALRRSQEQLRLSQKMDAIGQLAGGISHDFNNLLTIINGFAELMTNQVDPSDPLFRYSRTIAQAGARAAALTGQLLTISRRRVVETIAVDLNDLLMDMEELLRSALHEDIGLIVRPARDLWAVRGDPDQLSQVILNIAVNARDAMSNGGTFTIETANAQVEQAIATRQGTVAPGAYVTLTLRDTGIGMEAATQEHIFEPFFTTKPLGQGTGLGLATVYGIVTQAGGVIRVDSAASRGTTLTVYLPCAGDLLARTSVVETPELPQSGPATVLVVEDEPGVRTLAEVTLKAAGFTVLIAEDGEAALRVSSEHAGPIHLVLTDVVMPGMSGPAVAAQLRLQRPEIRVMFMSGYTADVALGEGGLDVTAEFVQKPFSPRALRERVRSILQAE